MKHSKQDIEELVNQLEQSTKLKKNGKCIKFSNTVNGTNIQLDSWKFLDWDYGKDKIKLPIQARGLFTFNDEEILVRGYDKFFNVNEKQFTQEDSLKKNTIGPYDVTLKENGCIIFISGYHDQIIVCSKHSTGQRDETVRNHALEGEHHLKRQLGDKLFELAQYLYSNNLTAIAELCDDEFEEHVLSYPKDKSGLYLHGLNYNTIEFNTVPIKDVNEFAKTWGFKLIEYLTYDNVDQLFEFLHDCSKTGTYDQREVEGFVIRCKKLDNSDFFFKYKFEEPYLLYRQFREVTRQLIDGVPIHSIRMKKNKYITRKYLEFANNLFQQQPNLKSQFLEGHGIIKVRQLFLEHLHESTGMNLLNLDEKFKEPEKLDTVKYVIIPIATIGCGKTTLFMTLNNLFPDWIHIQNDNVAKKAKLKVTELCLKALDNNRVVLFDRNNSERRERKQIFDTINQKRGDYIDDIINLKYIGLNFINDVSDDELWDITFNRIKNRGNNHQSIQFENDPNLVINVMKGFIKRFQNVDTNIPPDSNFDLMIKLNINSSLENVKTVINKIHNQYPDLIKSVPSDSEINSAFESALNYKPTFIKDMTTTKLDPQYYGISINSTHVYKLLESISDNENYKSMKEQKFIQEEFHVTLAHISSSKGNKQKWKNIIKKLGLGDSNQGKNELDFKADIKPLQFVVNEGKLICIKVELLRIKQGELEIEIDIEPLNLHLHITVGCFPPTLAYQSNTTLTELYKDSMDLKKDGIYEIGDDRLKVVNLKHDIIEDQPLFVYF
ncbi:unnamed protein product [Candida verbasci]|uniref:tRNA ligase n=1 Tax=Candida verbasci TaxID=1227364 RepID=A0A9W4U012_9ASCO|nr:unnamed protein product [Candida verbasci]